MDQQGSVKEEIDCTFGNPLPYQIRKFLIVTIQDVFNQKINEEHSVGKRTNARHFKPENDELAGIEHYPKHVPKDPPIPAFNGKHEEGIE